MTTSKTKQFCETSSLFEVDNIKNETLLRDFLQEGKVECRADGLVPMRFVIFPLHLYKVLRLPRNMHLCGSSSNVPRLPWFLEMLQNPHVLLTFDKVHNPLRLPRKTTSERPKVVRRNGVHFFDISTSKSDFEMCFAPQRRALFRHLNFQKWSDPVCALYILTSKCASRHNGVHFFDISTSKSGRTWCALYILTSKCASRHNGVHFFDITTSKVLRS